VIRQPDLFDLDAGIRRREDGLGITAERRAGVLAEAQSIALHLGRQFDTVTADDVQAALDRRGISPEELGPAAGAIFRGRRWSRVGFQPSKRVSNNGRIIGVWRFQE